MEMVKLILLMRTALYLKESCPPPTARTMRLLFKT